MDTSGKLFCFAAATRCAYLAIILTCSHFLESYDTSSTLVDDTCDGSGSTALRNPAISKLQVWDTIFYSRIANCGYEYEQYHAFFPLVPHVMGLVAQHLFSGYHPQDAYLLAALLINNLAFCTTIVLFYAFSEQVLRSKTTALIACIFYCCSPASVFHSMAYTEAVFGLTTMLGIYLLYCHNSILSASLSFAASAGIRSNGFVNLGFILHHCLKQGLAALPSSRLAAAGHCTKAAVPAVLVAAPYAAFQYFGYVRYCQQQQEPRPWCDATIPSLYGFVQSHYWGVGLFKYYQLSQVSDAAALQHSTDA